MIQRRKTPWRVLFFVFLVLYTAAYYLCGLYKMDGVALNNFQGKLLYILMHLLQNWWTEKTPAFMGVAFLAWIMLVGYYLDQYRNYHFGVENGSE